MKALLAAALASTLLAQSAPAPDSAPVPAPAEATKVERPQRLEREQKRLEAELAAIDQFGREAEFGKALDIVMEEFGPLDPGKKRWRRTERGWLPIMSVTHWLAWSRPGTERRKQPLCLDFDFRDHPQPVIADLAAQFAAHGIELLVVVFPSRLELYPELVLPAWSDALAKPPSDPAPSAPVPSGPKFHGMVGPTTRFLLELVKGGVEVVDLAPEFVAQRFAELPAAAEGANRELYLWRNQHWTPRAAELAAKLVAERLRELPCFVPGPFQEGRDFEIGEKTIDFDVGNGGAAPDTNPEKIWFHQVRMKGRTVTPDLRAACPIVVIGDSFIEEYLQQRASFEEQLLRFTGWGVDVVAPKGGAELACRESLARRNNDLHGKKIVVWLLQEQNLQPLPAYRKVAMFDR